MTQDVLWNNNWQNKVMNDIIKAYKCLQVGKKAIFYYEN